MEELKKKSCGNKVKKVVGLMKLYYIVLKNKVMEKIFISLFNVILNI